MTSHVIAPLRSEFRERRDAALHRLHSTVEREETMTNSAAGKAYGTVPDETRSQMSGLEFVKGLVDTEK